MFLKILKRHVMLSLLISSKVFIGADAAALEDMETTNDPITRAHVLHLDPELKAIKLNDSLSIEDAIRKGRALQVTNQLSPHAEHAREAAIQHLTELQKKYPWLHLKRTPYKNAYEPKRTSVATPLMKEYLTTLGLDPNKTYDIGKIKSQYDHIKDKTTEQKKAYENILNLFYSDDRFGQFRQGYFDTFSGNPEVVQNEATLKNEDVIKTFIANVLKKTKDPFMIRRNIKYLNSDQINILLDTIKDNTDLLRTVTTNLRSNNFHMLNPKSIEIMCPYFKDISTTLERNELYKEIRTQFSDEQLNVVVNKIC